MSTRVIIRVKASIMPGIFVKNMIKHVLTLFKTHFWCDEICFMTRLENDEVKRRWHVMPWAKQHDMVTLTRKKVWQRPAQLWWFELFSWCTISLKKDKKIEREPKKGELHQLQLGWLRKFSFSCFREIINFAFCEILTKHKIKIFAKFLRNSKEISRNAKY